MSNITEIRIRYASIEKPVQKSFTEKWDFGDPVFYLVARIIRLQ